MSSLAAAPQHSPQLLDAAGVQRATVRLAHEIAEHHPALAGVALIGVPTRGVPLAARIATQLVSLGYQPVPVGAIDASAYRDDRPRPAGERSRASLTGLTPTQVDGARVIVVDDVLFTGRTMRAVLDALIDCGRPAQVEVLTLVDRGHRELPLRAAYVGKNVPTSMEDRVTVRLRETDGVDGAWLVRAAAP